MNPLSFLLVCFAGWMNRRQQAVIEYLQEEVRVLQEQLGKRPRFTEMRVTESPSERKSSRSSVGGGTEMCQEGPVNRACGQGGSR